MELKHREVENAAKVTQLVTGGSCDSSPLNNLALAYLSGLSFQCSPFPSLCSLSPPLKLRMLHVL